MKTDWAYLAGFFDGEGCISVQKSKSYRNPLNPAKYYTVRLSTANTNKDVIDYLEKLWGQKLRVYTRKMSDPRGNRRPCYHLECDKKDAVITFLKGIYPYSIIKKRQIELALRLIEHIAINNYMGRVVPKKIIEYREKLVTEIKICKQS